MSESSSSKTTSSSSSSPPTAEVVVHDDERAIRAEVWKGSVPVCLSLAPSDVATLTPPPPLYLMAPRGSYLPLVLAASAAIDRFAPHAPPSLSASSSSSSSSSAAFVWCEALATGAALRWTLPIGVLYDMHRPAEGAALWELALHFGPPQQQQQGDFFARLPAPGPALDEAVRTLFMSALKEATCLKHGSVAPINGLSQKETLDLWVGVSANDEKRFWAVNARLDTMEPKHVPVRVVVAAGAAEDASGVPLCDLVQPSATLGQAVAQILGVDETDLAKTRHVVLVQGTQFALDTPVAWLCRMCAHPDNFLYAVVFVEQ